LVYSYSGSGDTWYVGDLHNAGTHDTWQRGLAVDNSTGDLLRLKGGGFGQLPTALSQIYALDRNPARWPPGRRM